MSPEAGDTGQTFSEHTSQHWTGKRLPWRSGDGPLKEEKKKNYLGGKAVPIGFFPCTRRDRQAAQHGALLTWYRPPSPPTHTQLSSASGQPRQNPFHHWLCLGSLS